MASLAILALLFPSLAMAGEHAGTCHDAFMRALKFKFELHKQVMTDPQQCDALLEAYQDKAPPIAHECDDYTWGTIPRELRADVDMPEAIGEGTIPGSTPMKDVYARVIRHIFDVLRIKCSNLRKNSGR